MSVPPLMVSISGIRGVSGTSFRPDTVVQYVGAFGQMLEGSKVAVGRDSRKSGPWVQRVATGVLMAQGFEVVDLGIVTTPTVQYMVTSLGCCGGLVVTSSHNPEEWNGLKFVDADGLFLAPARCKDLFAAAAVPAGLQYSPWDGCGSLRRHEGASQAHVDAILNLDLLPAPAVRARAFKVAFDAVNGAGGEVLGLLLEQLGCTVVPLNAAPSGVFAHEPEPLAAHLTGLCAAVVEGGADIGIALDPDGDRCVLVDEQGSCIGEEYTLALAAQYVLGVCGRRGKLCKNLSTSRAIDTIAQRYGCPVVAAPVGEIHVAKLMQEAGAVLGGEGNGGVMLPDLHIGRDGPVAAALTLAHLAASSFPTLSALKASLPQYHIAKLKAPIAGIDGDAVIAHFRSKYEDKDGFALDMQDGLKIDAEDWWVHLRKSNTEPVLRVIGEHATPAQALQLCQGFLDAILALA